MVEARMVEARMVEARMVVKVVVLAAVDIPGGLVAVDILVVQEEAVLEWVGVVPVSLEWVASKKI